MSRTGVDDVVHRFEPWLVSLKRVAEDLPGSAARVDLFVERAQLFYYSLAEMLRATVTRCIGSKRHWRTCFHIYEIEPQKDSMA
jgi:hypothetical protein